MLTESMYVCSKALVSTAHSLLALRLKVVQQPFAGPAAKQMAIKSVSSDAMLWFCKATHSKANQIKVNAL